MTDTGGVIVHIPLLASLYLHILTVAEAHFYAVVTRVTGESLAHILFNQSVAELTQKLGRSS